MNRTGMLSRVTAAGVALAFATTLAACSSSSGGGGATSSGGGSTALPGKGKPAIVLGDKNFAEQYLLGALYQQALQAKGYKVTLKENLGSSELADKLLASGKIDGIPEYTGVIFTELAKLGDRPKSAAATYAGAKKYEASNGFTALPPTPFQDADGFAVLNAYAKQHNLKTIADMKSISSFSYGGPPENKTRFQGVKGLTQVYGLKQIDFKPLTIGSQYQALDQNKVDSIAIFTTDGQLASGKYTVLTDTKGIFGYQQVTPVFNTKKLAEEGPEFTATVNKLSGLLTTKAIIALNKAVQIQKIAPAKVAAAFLKQNGMS